LAIIWKGIGGVEIAGLIVNLRAFNSRCFGHQDKKPFKDFETFFRMADYPLQQSKPEVRMWVNRFQVQSLFKKLFRPAEIAFFHHEICKVV